MRGGEDHPEAEASPRPANLRVGPAQSPTSSVSHACPAPISILCFLMVPAAKKEGQNLDRCPLLKPPRLAARCSLHPPCLPADLDLGLIGPRVPLFSHTRADPGEGRVNKAPISLHAFHSNKPMSIVQASLLGGRRGVLLGGGGGMNSLQVIRTLGSCWSGAHRVNYRT